MWLIGRLLFWWSWLYLWVSELAMACRNGVVERLFRLGLPMLRRKASRTERLLRSPKMLRMCLLRRRHSKERRLVRRRFESPGRVTAVALATILLTSCASFSPLPKVSSPAKRSLPIAEASLKPCPVAYYIIPEGSLDDPEFLGRVIVSERLISKVCRDRFDALVREVRTLPIANKD